MLISTLLFFVLLAYIVSSLFTTNKGVLMCGIIGFSGAQNFDVNKIKSLFLYNAIRGIDGYGIHNNGKITKDAIDIYAALPTLEIIPEQTFIGHTRKSTYVNYKATKHCHPFKYNNLIGVHNGTLTNHYSLVTNYGLRGADFDTDTEMLYAMMSSDLNVLKRIKGTASLLFTYTNALNTLYCFRKNEERPLFRGKTEEGLYISSMEESLEYIGCTDIEPFKVGYLYKITDGKIESTRQIAEYVEKETKSEYSYNDNDYYTETNFYEKNEFIAKKNDWVKVTYIDHSADGDNRGRIEVGKYYKLAADVYSSGSVYASLVVHQDKHGHNLAKGATEHILWRHACLEVCKNLLEGDVAIAMYKGRHGTDIGDFCKVTKVSYPNGKRMLEYDIIGPTIKRSTNSNGSFSWDSENFRPATKDELKDLYAKKGKDTHPYILKILGNVADHTKSTAAGDYLPTDAKLQLYKTIATRIDNLSAVDEESVIMHIRQQLIQGKSFAVAVDTAFSILGLSAEGKNPEEDDATVPETIDTTDDPEDKACCSDPLISTEQLNQIYESFIKVEDLYNDAYLLNEDIDSSLQALDEYEELVTNSMSVDETQTYTTSVLCKTIDQIRDTLSSASALCQGICVNILTENDII